MKSKIILFTLISIILIFFTLLFNNDRIFKENKGEIQYSIDNSRDIYFNYNSKDKNIVVKNYKWIINDTNIVSNEKNFKYKFLSSGNYKITLVLETNNGEIFLNKNINLQ